MFSSECESSPTWPQQRVRRYNPRPSHSVHPDTREVAAHMREFGLAILGRAAYDLTFSEMMAPYKHAMAIGHAAHGAEIVIKARIAQEHPLLLFTHLPNRRTRTRS